jgi:hypothetical protein
MDDRYGALPLYPTTMSRTATAPRLKAMGKRLVLAPEDPERALSVTSTADLLLYDGRSKAQNGWYVLRGLLPGGTTGRVLEWSLSAHSIEDWVRAPVIGHCARVSPLRKRRPSSSGIRDTAEARRACTGRCRRWAESNSRPCPRPGAPPVTIRTLTFPQSEGSTTSNTVGSKPRRSDRRRRNENICSRPGHLPAGPDGPRCVNEAYRWHGASHLDDALQAPVDHVHFDLYAQGPTTDTPYRPGEHIPGLNVGGWYDAGDYDIRTQSQYAVVNTLVNVWETFRLERDNTLVDYARKYVDLHVPDGKPDLLQQIEHGTLALLAQHRAVGHAIPGIVEPSLEQYTHLGDGLTKTDNRVHDPGLDTLESDGFRSGLSDDRWAFTSRTSALEYGSIAALPPPAAPCGATTTGWRRNPWTPPSPPGKKNRRGSPSFSSTAIRPADRWRSRN